MRRERRDAPEQRLLQAHTEQQEPSSAPLPLRVEKGLYSSFVFTGGLLGDNRNIHQNKDSNYAKGRELLGWVFL